MTISTVTSPHHLHARQHHPGHPECQSLSWHACTSPGTHQRGGHHLFEPLGLGLVVEVHTAHEVISWKRPMPPSHSVPPLPCCPLPPAPHSHASPLLGVMEVTAKWGWGVKSKTKRGQPSTTRAQLQSGQLNLTPDTKNSGWRFLCVCVCVCRGVGRRGSLLGPSTLSQAQEMLPL